MKIKTTKKLFKNVVHLIRKFNYLRSFVSLNKQRIQRGILLSSELVLNDALKLSLRGAYELMHQDEEESDVPKLSIIKMII